MKRKAGCGSLGRDNPPGEGSNARRSWSANSVTPPVLEHPLQRCVGTRRALPPCRGPAAKRGEQVMLRGVSPRASPTVTGGAVEPGHHTAVCGWGRFGCRADRLCAGVLVFAAIPLCNHLPERGWGVMERPGAALPLTAARPRRGAVEAGGAPGAPLPPVPGSGGGPAAVRAAFSSPSPSPLSSLGVRALCAACSAERGPAAERPLRRLFLPGDGRSPRHSRPFCLLDGAPRRLWGHQPDRHRPFKRRATPGDGAGRARPPTWCGARVPGRRRSGAHSAWGGRWGFPGGGSGPGHAPAPRRAPGLHRRRLPR